MRILPKDEFFSCALHRLIQGILFLLPWVCSEGITFHHSFIKDILFYTLTPCVFLSALHQQMREYHQGKPTFYRHPLWLCLLLWFFWSLFVLEPGNKSLSVVPLLNLFCVLFLIQGFSRLLTQKELLNSWINALIYGSGVASILFVISFFWNHLDFTGQPAHGYERPFYNPNALALFLIVPFFLSVQSFVSNPSKKTMRFPCLFLMTLMVAGSEGAWAGLFCGGLTWALILLFRTLGIRKNILGALVLLALLASFVVLPFFLERLTSSSILARHEIYKATLALWQHENKSAESPLTLFQIPERFGTLKQWTGYGAGSFRTHYGNFRTLRYALLYMTAPNTASPHNFQWEILIETGIIGLGLFYLILWFFFAYAHTVLTQQTSPQIRSLVCSCLAGMVALLVDGLTSHFFLSTMNWFSVSFLTGILSSLYFSSKVFRNPYPHYLLGVPSNKQKKLDRSLFVLLLIWSAIFFWEFVYKSFQAEMWLKQSSRKEGKSPEERLEFLSRVLNFSFETETRRVGRLYLIDVYQELALKYNNPAWWKEALNLALAQEKLYPKSGNTLIVIATCRWQLQAISSAPSDLQWFRSMQEYIVAFPFSPDVGEWLNTFLPRLKPHERLMLRDLGTSLLDVLKQAYKEGEKSSNLEFREKYFAKKMSTLSYHIYLLSGLDKPASSSSLWIENCLRWTPRHRGFRMLLAHFWFQQKQLSKANEALNAFTPSQLEYESRHFIQTKDQAFQEFLKQHWSDRGSLSKD